MTIVRWPRRIVLALVLVVTGACSAVLPKTQPSDFFVLTALEPTTASVPAEPSVLLGRVSLPAYLDRRELVTRLASNQVRVEDLELWAEPLRESVPMTIERDLATLLGDGRVQRQPWTRSTPPDLVVSVEISRFERTSHRTVELMALWTIADGRGGNVHVERRTRLSLAVAAEGTQASVRALSDTLAALSREIAAGLRQLTAPA
jgi:uncharacterized lipoprotein YmbA